MHPFFHAPTYKNRMECMLSLYGCYTCLLDMEGLPVATDLYYPVIPSHSCQRLKNFEHWRWSAILQVAFCCHQGLEGISQSLGFSSLDRGNMQEQKMHTQLQTLMFKIWLCIIALQSGQLCWHVFKEFPIAIPSIPFLILGRLLGSTLL